MQCSGRRYNKFITNLFLFRISTACVSYDIYLPIECHPTVVFYRVSLFVNYGPQSRTKLLYRLAYYWKVARILPTLLRFAREARPGYGTGYNRALRIILR